MSETAAIKVHACKQYECKQSKHEHLPKCPSRGVFLAPSGQFKTTAMVSLLLDHYRGCFCRIYVFSPSIDIDDNWDPVKEYSKKVLGVDQSKEKTFFHEWDEPALERIIADQHKMIMAQKKRGDKNLHNIVVIADDWSDNPTVLAARGRNMLNTLFIRGRHMNISTWVSAQRLKSMSVPIRTQTQFYCIGKLRSQTELMDLLESLTAEYPIKTMMKIYRAATDYAPHSFLYVDLTKQDADEMFWINFEIPIRAGAPPTESEEPSDSQPSHRVPEESSIVDPQKSRRR